MKVKAAVARAHRAPLNLEGLDLDEPLADEVLVRLIACGISSRDLATIDGTLHVPLPFVPGGEGAGIIERTGRDVRGLTVGDAVVVTFDHCKECPACRGGRPGTCVEFAARNLSGQRPDGLPPYGDEGGAPVHGRIFGQSAFATHLVCRADAAVDVGREAPLELLAGLGGELLPAAGTVLHGLSIRPGQCVLILGAEAPGLLAAMLAQALGAAVVVIADESGRHRAEIERIEPTLFVDSLDDLPALLRSLAADGADHVIDFLGSTMSEGAAQSCAAEGATMATTSAEENGAVAGVRHVPLIEYAPPRQLIEDLARLEARGDLPLARLVTYFAFEHVNDALDALRERAIAKPVLRFSLGAFNEVDRARVEGAAVEEPDADEPPEEIPVPIPVMDQEA